MFLDFVLLSRILDNERREFTHRVRIHDFLSFLSFVLLYIGLIQFILGLFPVYVFVWFFPSTGREYKNHLFFQ